MLTAGSIVNGIYEVLRPIGEGGAGQVFLAWHKNLEKNVVIKRIKDKFVGRINERGEADILKQLHHRYIPQVYDFIQTGGEVYTVIDHVDGNTLMQYIKEQVRFDEYQIVKWLKQLCEALDYLHTQEPPIIHSDIKPSNIMIDANGDIRLIDFNISFGEDDIEKISGYTAGYASPEQILKAQLYTTGGDHTGVRLDVKSDIFSLGASIYHIMTLKSPAKVFEEGGDLWDVGITLPYSKLLREIIEKSLERDPKKRYQTAKEMLLDLESMKVRDGRYKKLNRDQFVYNAVLLVVLVTGAFMTIKGVQLLNEEAFETEYKKIADEAVLDNYNKTIDDAIELLNNGKYSKVLDKNKEEKADLLYMIGNSYFEDEDYPNAISFYELMLQEYNGNPEYHRDCAIAYARTGDIQSAEGKLDTGLRYGLKDDDLYLVKAEIDLAKGERESAIGNFEKAIELTGNSTTLGRSYLLCARAYKQSGDLEGARDILERGKNVADDTWQIRLTREEGAVCMQAINQAGDKPSVWYETAEDCYKSLCNSGRDTPNDWLNLSLITKMKGDTKGAIGILNDAKQKYVYDYRIPMRQALFEIEYQSSVDKRDYKAAEGYYREAK